MNILGKEQFLAPNRSRKLLFTRSLFLPIERFEKPFYLMCQIVTFWAVSDKYFGSNTNYVMQYLIFDIIIIISVHFPQ